MTRKISTVGPFHGGNSDPFERPLLMFSLLFISLVLPNLVFSGPYFYSTLHLMKWAAALVPVALWGLWTGGTVAVRGAVATRFSIDSFATLWLLLLLYVTAQPFWLGLRSPETFFREWFFFASLWLVYVLAGRIMSEGVLKALCWGCLVNCALSVVFAELQVRVEGALPFFILPTPGYYIANTGQQNMLALWLALGGLNGAFLIFSRDEKKSFAPWLAAALLAVVFWGLISTTSRSGIMAFMVGFAVLSCYYVRNLGRKNLRKVVAVAVLFCAVGGLNLVLNEGRWGVLMNKMEDIFENPLSIAHRDSIWRTSWTMFTEQPLKGVGLGQYKWHYLDAQREMLKRWPGMKWQYTHWAHNEFLQWLAEAGIAGGLLMIFLWGWWALSALEVFFKKKDCSPGAYWGSAVIALFLFNGLWTRPFHRIENVLWLAVAFTMANREILLGLFQTPPPEEFRRGGRLIGTVMAVVSLIGLVYFGQGVWGDRMLRRAADEGNPVVKEQYLDLVSSSLMVRDMAEKARGYFLVSLGQNQEDPHKVVEGLNILLEVFEKQPHVSELSFLKGWSRAVDNEDLYEELSSYGEAVKSRDPLSEDI